MPKSLYLTYINMGMTHIRVESACFPLTGGFSPDPREVIKTFSRPKWRARVCACV